MFYKLINPEFLFYPHTLIIINKICVYVRTYKVVIYGVTKTKNSLQKCTRFTIRRGCTLKQINEGCKPPDFFLIKKYIYIISPFLIYLM